jgi:hypothetical protein
MKQSCVAPPGPGSAVRSVSISGSASSSQIRISLFSRRLESSMCPDCVNLMGACQVCTTSRCGLQRSTICLVDTRRKLRTVSCQHAQQTTARALVFTTVILTITSWNYRLRIISLSRRLWLSTKVKPSAETLPELMLIQSNTSGDIARAYHSKSCDGFQSPCADRVQRKIGRDQEVS